MKSLTLAVVAAGALLAGPAFAQNPQEEAMLRQACTGDYMRLCSQYEPGSPGLDQCFKAKMNDLTQQCRGAIQAYTKANPNGPKR